MDILTERLCLIPIEKTHACSIARYFDCDTVKYMSPPAVESLEQAEKIIDGFIALKEKGTDYVYAVTLKTDGEFLGVAGLHNLCTAPEAGVWIKSGARKNGYGKEAVGGILASAMNSGIEEVIYPVDRRNEASKKIALFYGGKFCGRHEEKTPDGRTLYIEKYIIDLKEKTLLF